MNRLVWGRFKPWRTDLAALQNDRLWTLVGVLLGMFNVALTGFLVGAPFALCRNLTAERPTAR